MRAMVLEASNTLAEAEVKRPAPGPGEALVRVTHSGLCGTDLKIFNGGIEVAHPLIMGHELIGELVEGEGAGGAVTGGRVIIDTALYCGTCFHCRAGLTNICPEGGLLGRDKDGGFAEFAVAPSANIHPLPDTVADDEAPLIQVLTTCLHAHRLADIFPGESVAVIGLGVTGLLHLQLAKARGASPLIGITRSAWKRELAGELGADLTLEPGPDTMEKVRQATGGRGADVVIESAGGIQQFAEALEMVRGGGRVVPFGIYTAKEGALPFYQLYFKEIQVIGARASKGEDYVASIDLVESGQIRLKPLISHVKPLGELADALAMLADGGAKRMKIILDHG